jgi:FAD/FMN-containing dehydrogenase/Fe-S oxidoreductase
MNKTQIETALRNEVQGEVLFDTFSKAIYSIDASIYEVAPVGVVRPKTQEELLKVVKIARDFQVPIIGRGAGTGIAGGCIGEGLVVDTSKYLRHIVDVNWEEGHVTVEPGVVQDELNTFLGKRGFRLGPDTSTGNRATIGGMVGNNSSGAHSLRYGKMVDHVLEIDLILQQGVKVNFSSLSQGQFEEKTKLSGPEGDIYRCIQDLLVNKRSVIEEKFPKISRRVAGYNLDELLKGFPLNLSSLITGSEGSFGITSQIKLKISPKPKQVGLCIIHFHDLVDSLRPMELYLDSGAYALEMVDEAIIKAAKTSPSMKSRLNWLQGDPQALIIVEFDAENKELLIEKIEEFSKKIQELKIGYATVRAVEEQDMKNVWALRKSGLGLLLSKRSFSRAIGFLEDIAVPPLKLADFMKEFKEILHSFNKESGIYGHAGEGCIHLRPFINLTDPKEVEVMEAMMLQVSQRLLDYGGTLSGEHGDGLVRSWLNEKMFGSEIYGIFKTLKNTFDPKGLANPGKVVEGPPLTQNLKLNPSSNLSFPETFLSFEKEGGVELAIDLCNGNGECRKKDSLMCPSYQATLDERHLTRGRAQSLRSLLHGRVDKDQFTSHELYEVMDLCLECKGCKTQCPSQIDMAKLKSEFLFHYQKKHGASWRSRLFAHVDVANKWMGKLPSLSNYISSHPLSKWGMGLLEIAPKRSLPALSSQRFSKMVSLSKKSSKKVGLFVDTFTEFHTPNVGIAAVSLLEKMGFEVIVIPWTCCGRPALSKGFLPKAKKHAQKVIQRLLPIAKQSIPIVGLEPSCLLTIVDDYEGLIPSADVKLVAKHCVLLDEFIASNLESLPPVKKETSLDIHYHVHCYQKALQGGIHTQKILSSLPMVSSEIPSGCCGMAGSFGYEKEHYETSMKIGELTLFPYLRKMKVNSAVIANGFSCRQQIHHGTDMTALHLSELLNSMY